MERSLKITLILATISVYSSSLVLYSRGSKNTLSPYNVVLSFFFLSLVLTLDFLFLSLVEAFNQTQHHENPRNRDQNYERLWKDLCDVVTLFVGLGIQLYVNVVGFIPFLLLLSCLVLSITIFIILKPEIDYGFIDLFISMLTQFLVYLAKNAKNERMIIWLFIGVSILCVALVFMRNRFEHVINVFMIRSNNDIPHENVAANNSLTGTGGLSTRSNMISEQGNGVASSPSTSVHVAPMVEA